MTADPHHLAACAVANQQVVALQLDTHILTRNTFAKGEHVADTVLHVILDGIFAIAEIYRISIAPSATTQDIVARATGEHILTIAAFQHVIAAIAVNPVADIGTGKCIARRVPLDHEGRRHQRGVIDSRAIGELEAIDGVGAECVLRIKADQAYHVALATVGDEQDVSTIAVFNKTQFVAQGIGLDSRPEAQHIAGIFSRQVVDVNLTIAGVTA